MKIIVGAFYFAKAKASLTIFGPSPIYICTRFEPANFKKVAFVCPAHALAIIVFPVPGGPNIKTPFHALLIPVKNCGILKGSKTASCNNPFAFYNSAISSN